MIACATQDAEARYNRPLTCVKPSNPSVGSQTDTAALRGRIISEAFTGYEVERKDGNYTTVQTLVTGDFIALFNK